jgi:hypothetical protein
VNRTEELIATGLRDIAEEARDPRSLADVAWRAGRRRRLAGMISAGAGGAAAIAIAVTILSGQVAGSPVGTGKGLVPASGTRLPAAITTKLRTPLELRQITGTSQQPCSPHSAGVPGVTMPGAGSSVQCFSLGPNGMTITSVRSATVRFSRVSDEYVVLLSLHPSGALRLARLSTYYEDQGPRARIAFIVGGRVVAASMLEEPVTNGELTIPCASEASAEHLLANLLAARRPSPAWHG